MMASLSRILAVLMKEFIQMRRDRLTFAMMVGIPLVQLLLFGYAINTDPRHLPTLIELGDDGPAVRAIIETMENSEYFDIQGTIGPGEADAAMRTNETIFILVIPPDFERDLMRGEQPDILLDVDASDPVAAGAGAGAFPQIVARALAEQGAGPPAANAVIHRRYNPSGETAMNIVPGLLGIILTMTMAMMTSMAITKEAERGTLETLLATPTRPLEVMAGKIAPYVLVGALQVALMLLAARYLFGVPFWGDPRAFLLAVTLFILVNLSLGFLFSTLARTQMQAMQMTFFVFLPSILLSGFMFPFSGMPAWARTIGEAIPATHFIRAVRAIMLKGADTAEVLTDLWPLAVIFAVIATLALTRYRRTLD
ncbi:ABC transporter permease [Hyphobacterium sp. HN65]|uniref:ABC transporter permease n=1 Tax=Hyphobacterium lacteum TaxID=3116575 RepID=A0ABU7LNE3_9PROT|nr:ABC transporter permease [Hyphobacterium sp. HN65]MEE2525438.1 ABC transporter permease [Hyphobacterium sp. HN65]